MLRKGNATHDQVCLDQLPTYLTPSTLSMRFSNDTNNSDLRRFKENLVTSASGDLLSVTTTENPNSTPEGKAWAGTSPTSAKGEMTTGGNKDRALTLSSTFYLEVSLVNTIFMRELSANPLWLVKWCLWSYVQTHRSAQGFPSVFSQPVLPLCAVGIVLWAVVLSVTVLLGGMLIFWKWKVCKKRILILRRKREFFKL